LTVKQTRSLVDRDAAVIWHPYTQHKTGSMPLPIVKGEGVYLIDEKW
jgi:adenosylmethionine-8-amino-7-oxononanoate aminotransferase